MPRRSSKRATGDARNRASPARLFKLYEFMSNDQKDKIKGAGFGGLLDFKCDCMPADLSKWLIKDCFDAEKCQLVFSGRGTISVSGESAHDMLGLPNPTKGEEVKYEMDCDAVKFIHDKYGVDSGVAPRIKTFVEMLEKSDKSDDDYLRSWLMLAICTFLCPATGLGMSPRCYPSVVDISSVDKLKWGDFVVKQLAISKNKMGKRNSVKGCLFYLVILYLDSLEHNLEIPDCKPRIGAWTTKLMEKVVEMDRKEDGSFGKLKLKQSKHTVIETSMANCFVDIERFVSSKVPRGLSSQ
ncbi:hypothetical protein EJB05_11942, partial [Eragrostis curvula]